MKNKIRYLIYSRVSDRSQVDGMSLDEQERQCENYGKKNNWVKVREPFREEGESAKNVKRTQLRELTKFCLDKKNKIDYVLIYKWWRLTRNLEESTPLEALLAQKGIKFISITEPFEDNAMGRFTKKLNILLGQLDNEIKGEITVDNMKAKFNDGYWLWRCPIGYKKKYAKGLKPEDVENPILIDPNLGKIVTRVFELAATGQYTQSQLAQKMNLMGFKKYYGSDATIKQVGIIIQKSFYYGFMHAKKWDEYCWGNHKPLIDEVVWRKANKYIFGTPKTYNPQDQDFYPLKMFVKCSGCSGYIKAYKNHKKNINYYECKNIKCKGKQKLRIQVDSLHDHFVDLLSFYKPNERVMKLFDKLVFSEWDKVIKSSRDKQKKSRILIQKQDELIDIYLDRFERGDYTKEKKDQKVEEAKMEMVILEEELEESKFEQYNKETLRNFTEFFLTNIDRLWLRMNYQQKIILQQKLFPSGISHNRKKFLTDNIENLTWSIKIIGEISSSKNSLVPPPGIEPGAAA